MTIMELDEAPEHLIVLGGGYVGLAFGQMFHRLRGRATIVQRGDQLLVREDVDVAMAVAGILREDGVDVVLNSRVRRDTCGADSALEVTLRSTDGSRTMLGSHLLVAAGQVPNTDALNPGAACVRTDQRGHIPVNERLETNVPGIYALGGVNGGPVFTHISYDDFRIMRTNRIEGGSATTHGRLVPYTVFIDPQLGRVGLSETEARAQGRAVRVAKLPMSSVARAIEVDETRSFMCPLGEGNRRRRERADPWLCGAGHRRWRAHVRHRGRHDRQAALYCPAGWNRCASNAGRVAQQSIYGHGRSGLTGWLRMPI